MGLLQRYGLYSKETGFKLYSVVPQSRFNNVGGIIGTYTEGQQMYLTDFELEDFKTLHALEVGPADRDKEGKNEEL